jgi:molybdopterin-containing oxidoreductase family iron-sulfur binding subunit
MSDRKDGIKNQDPNYWRSFEELHSDPEFLNEVKNEFKDGASNAPNTGTMSPLSRRKFLALLGASAAVAGTACSDYQDKGEIVPYTNKPEEITLGKSNFYASTCNGCSSACGILVKTREGRPVKIDGNPDHPVSKGKVCSQGQASIMGLYDPDRIQSPKRITGNRTEDISWQEADEDIVLALSTIGNSEIAVITNQVVSPTEDNVLKDFIREYPSTKVYSFEQFNESIRNNAWQKCYGVSEFPLIKWNEAEVVVSLDADFLGTGSNRVENTRLFAEGRDVMNKKFNRLYAVESNLSLTGMNADYRLRLRADAQYEFVMAIINKLQSNNVIANTIDTSGFKLSKIAADFSLSEKTLKHIIKDLSQKKGKAIVYAGDHLPEEVHIAVNLLNEELGNTILYDTKHSKSSVRKLSSPEDLRNLSTKMNYGEVGMVIHLGSNPVYNFPADINYSTALQNVKTVITFTEIENESSYLSNYIVPVHSTFEAWGDAKTRTGFYSLQQPVIAPLYDTRQKESVLLTWINSNSGSYDETLYHKYLRKNWETEIYPTLNARIGFKKFWYGALHDGVVRSYDNPENNGSFNYAALSGLTKQPSNFEGVVVHLTESYSVKDGRFANNGWLQESPHPVSKVTWDNYAAVSTATANKLGVQKDDLIEIIINERKLSIPAFVQPGLADDSIIIQTGYGRSVAGTVGSGVGFNANILCSSNDGVSPWLFNGAEVTKTTGSYKLVVAQAIYDYTDEDKKNLPEKRGIIREGTVEEYLHDPHFLHGGEAHNLESVNPPIAYDGIKWGMSIDLNKCLGCSECFVACNVENNIPVVGKEEVDEGREMHWLRIDRYYSGTPEDPVVSTQPMLCQHCDQAPCENVCPVAATTHSPDGLNQMVYNRCVGTRYCSNNCPYKVRRFNFFNFRDSFKDSYQESPVFTLLNNPEVTVRSRGVMEKCTFCIQRIADARSDATRDGKEIVGSDVTTACQDACVTNAIQFGDINNQNEEFYKYRNHELGYYVLDELNVKPNVTYLARLRNTDLEDA